MLSSGVAYLLWLGCCVGLCGLHRFYAGKPLSGLLWLFTLGLIGFGQLLDLILIPGMIQQANSAGGYDRGERGGTVNVYIDNSGRGRGRRDDFDFS